VEAFNQLLVTEKYREAEQMVLPESRDAYYTSEKPRILDFKVKKIDWDAGFQSATVEMSSNIMARRATIGAFKVDSGYLSHWKLDKGEWFFYYPQVTERQTPFGVMKVNPTLASQSGMNLDQELAKGRAELASVKERTFAADKTAVTLPTNNSSETIVLTNLLPGPIRVAFVRSSGSGFDVLLTDANVGPKGEAHLKIYRSPKSKGEFKPGAVVVRSQPTGQTLSIAVN
jgi:hypothetical protein